MRTETVNKPLLDEGISVDARQIVAALDFRRDSPPEQRGVALGIAVGSVVDVIQTHGDGSLEIFRQIAEKRPDQVGALRYIRSIADRVTRRGNPPTANPSRRAA